MRPTLHTIDWTLIAIYGLFAITLGAFFTRKASKSVSSFFVGDRNLPWWIAGTSIVATTFAADTPLAVTGLVAKGGIAANWLWWSWAIAHLTATFLFARMWRRSGVITDAEITELRYGGKAAAALRGFKAIYFGIFINCLIMAWVIAAMVKISRAFFDVEPWTVIILCVALSVLYTILGGFRSVVFTDLVQFALGMGGAIALAVIAVNRFGGIGRVAQPGTEGSGLLGQLSEVASKAGDSVADYLDFIPGADHPNMPPIAFAVLLIAGWWRYAEGNGYIVQRLAACKDEGHAQGASLWFAVAHNALRPWPWILVGLAALVVFPSLGKEAPKQLTAATRAGVPITVAPGSIDVATGGRLTLTGVEVGDMVEVLGQLVSVKQVKQKLVAEFDPFQETTLAEVSVYRASGEIARFSGLHVELTDREMGYPLLMGLYLPPGLLGLVIVSLLAAFMSTIDTHTNWGASYLVQDLYRRFIRPNEKGPHYVWVSRACIVLIAILAGLAALIVENIAEVWRFLITLGAGLGSVTAVRWYWSRVTPYAEFAALGVTTFLAVGLQLFCTAKLFGAENSLLIREIPGWAQIIIIATGSLATWIPVALFGPKNDDAVLERFAAKVRPPGPGWRKYREGPTEAISPLIIKLIAGGVVIYGSLFGIGDILLGRPLQGCAWILLASLLLAWIIRRPPDTETA